MIFGDLSTDPETRPEGRARRLRCNVEVGYARLFIIYKVVLGSFGMFCRNGKEKYYLLIYYLVAKC